MNPNNANPNSSTSAGQNLASKPVVNGKADNSNNSNTKTGDDSTNSSNYHMKSLQMQQPHLQLKYMNNQAFWKTLQDEIASINPQLENFSQHHEVTNEVLSNLLKLESNTMTLTPEAKLLMQRMLETFILDLTLKSLQSKSSDSVNRIEHIDVLSAIQQTDNFDFLQEMADISGQGNQTNQ